MTSFFHTYDLRGLHPEEIDVEEAEKVGKAFGTFVDAEEVLIGRDGRKHGEKILEAFIRGLKSTGADVATSGIVPSPVIYYGQRKHGFGAAVVVTASHNPAEYTGFKFCREEALAMSREGGMKQIQEIYEKEAFQKGEGEEREIDLVEDYIEAVKDTIGATGLELKINCGNGVTGMIAEELFEALECDVSTINCEVDGEFPNHLPDPGNEEAQEALSSGMEDEELGIIFDGDGDRAGFILPGYGYIPEDEVLALFSEEALKKRKGKVIYDLRASKLVPEVVKENGGTPVETRVGHTFISEAIHEDPEIVFAGELSGHYYFPEWDFPFDDALFAAALMTQIAAKTDLIRRLENYPDYPVSPELRIDCPNDAKKEVVNRVEASYPDREITDLDGAKIHFEKGWALVRPSSTEPKMSVRVEADTEEDMKRILSEIEACVQEAIEEASS